MMYHNLVVILLITTRQYGLNAEEEEPKLFRGYLFNKIKKAVPNILERWRDFKQRRQLFAMSEMEEKSRFFNFGKNIRFILFINSLNHSFQLDINDLTHLSREEYFQMLGSQPPQESEEYANITNTESDADQAETRKTTTTSKDWRTENVVTPVKNQGSCGSCYAFTSIAAMESRSAIKTKKLLTYSEQAVVDCSTSYGNHGCNGGSISNSYNYMKKNGPIENSKYPYTGKAGSCKQTNPTPVVKSMAKIPSGDEATLSKTLIQSGPIGLAIDARLDSFRFYKSGIYQDKDCSSTELNHGVTLVGVQSGSSPYYIVKNSWGVNWGEKGYAKIAKDKNNMCGVATDAIYPIL